MKKNRSGKQHSVSTTKVRYIDVSGTERVEVVSKPPTFEAIGEFIKGPGYVESITILVDVGEGETTKACMYFHEEAAIQMLSINEEATRLLKRSAALMKTTIRQPILGNVVITQPIE